MQTLSAIDLNLVVALHALLEEGNVTRAARRIGISQPSMSHALARLREHFDDPLLLRSGNAMTLTHRGTELLAEVRVAVGDLQRLFLLRPFEPASLSLDLRVVMDDWMGVVLLPRFVAMLSVAAPGVDLDVLPRGAPGRKALLRQGAVDLAVGFFSGAGTDLLRQHLFDDDWVIVMRQQHPAGEVPLTVQRWACLTHIIVSPTGGRRGSLDAWLQGEGLSRRVAVAVPHFLAALALAAETDHVLAVPRSLAVARAARFGLSVCEPPATLPPFAVSMCWHARTEHDLAHRWLRSLFAEAASGIASRVDRAVEGNS